MWRLKSNYLWETGPEEGARPLAKWFTLRAILFYRLLNSLDHSKICMYYSAFERKNCCPARLPSAFWTLWYIWGMLPFRIRLKSYFSAWGQMKWVGKKGGLSSVPPSNFSLPLIAAKAFKCKIYIYIYIRGETAWASLDVPKLEERGRRSWGSAAKGRNFHLYEKLFKNIWCSPDAEIECVRRVVPNASRCKVKGLSPLQGQVICRIIVTHYSYEDDSSELDKIVHYRLFTFSANNLKSLMVLTVTAVSRSISNIAHGRSCVSLVHSTLVPP